MVNIRFNFVVSGEEADIIINAVRKEALEFQVNSMDPEFSEAERQWFKQASEAQYKLIEKMSNTRE